MSEFTKKDYIEMAERLFLVKEEMSKLKKEEAELKLSLTLALEDKKEEVFGTYEIKLIDAIRMSLSEELLKMELGSLDRFKTKTEYHTFKIRMVK